MYLKLNLPTKRCILVADQALKSPGNYRGKKHRWYKRRNSSQKQRLVNLLEFTNKLRKKARRKKERVGIGFPFFITITTQQSKQNAYCDKLGLPAMKMSDRDYYKVVTNWCKLKKKEGTLGDFYLTVVERQLSHTITEDIHFHILFFSKKIIPFDYAKEVSYFSSRFGVDVNPNVFDVRRIVSNTRWYMSGHYAENKHLSRPNPAGECTQLFTSRTFSASRALCDAYKRDADSFERVYFPTLNELAYIKEDFIRETPWCQLYYWNWFLWKSAFHCRNPEIHHCTLYDEPASQLPRLQPSLEEWQMN